MTIYRRILLLGLWFVAFGVTDAAAREPYLEDNRERYIASVLQAFDATDLTTVINTARYLDVVRRNNCRSSVSDLRADCLLSYARKNCETAGDAIAIEQCTLYSDVIVVNKLNEGVFIGRSERYGIMKGKRGRFRDVLASRLEQKYARIVTHFSITEGADCKAWDINCLARGLDQFCLDYANNESLSWHHCVGAALWMMGTAKPAQ